MLSALLLRRHTLHAIRETHEFHPKTVNVGDLPSVIVIFSPNASCCDSLRIFLQRKNVDLFRKSKRYYLDISCDNHFLLFLPTIKWSENQTSLQIKEVNAGCVDRI